MKLPVFNFLILTTTLCASLATQSANAEQIIDHLYDARIPMADRSAEEQQRAIELGLATVLVKLSGYSEAADFPELASQLKQASALVSEYGIENMNIASADGLAATPTSALHMRFVREAVDQILRRYEIPLWPASRPNILFLVVTEFADRPYLLTRTNSPAVYALLEQLAYDRGFNLTLLDQESLSNMNVSANSVWNLDRSTLQATFALLPIDSIGIIRLYSKNEMGIYAAINQQSPSFGRLSLIEDRDTYSAEIKGEQFVVSMRASLDQYLDQLSLQKSFISGTASDVRALVKIEGVTNFSAFQRIRNYLQSLEQIGSIQLLRLSGDQLVFQLEVQSSETLLRAGLSNSGFLSPSSANSDAELPGITQLNYRYRAAIDADSSRNIQ